MCSRELGLIKQIDSTPYLSKHIASAVLSPYNKKLTNKVRFEAKKPKD